jgi:hypothetical protein
MKPISTALLKEQLKRYWLLLPLTMLGYLFFVLLPIYLHPGGRDPLVSAQVMIEVLSMRSPFMLIATVLTPFGVVMALFSYLFDSRATAGFYGFSETKRQLYWTNVVTGAILMIVPLLITALFMLIRVRYPIAYNIAYPADLFSRGLAPDAVINTFGSVLGFFARMAVSYLFFFAVFLLAVTLSGNAKVSVLLSVLFPLLPTVFYRLGQMIISIYVRGYDTLSAPLPDEILSFANPLSWFSESLLTASVYVFDYVNVASPRPIPVMAFTNPLTWFWNWGERSQGLYFLSYIGIMFVADAWRFSVNEPEVIASALEAIARDIAADRDYERNYEGEARESQLVVTISIREPYATRYNEPFLNLTHIEYTATWLMAHIGMG